MNNIPHGIYGIVTEKLCKGQSIIETATQMVEGGIRILQYREKEDKPKSIQYQECMFLQELCKKAGVVFIVNDAVDLALACDADGVHIGQDDLPPAIVRNLLGRSKILGLSTHTPQQAEKALQEGVVDYIGVGPLFPTQTKIHPEGPVGLSYLDYVVRSIPLPFVAIGGIKEHNLPEVLEHGAKTVCLVTEITEADDIKNKLIRLRAILAHYGIA